MDDIQHLLAIRNRWSSAIKSSCAVLERGDFRQVTTANTWSDVECQICDSHHEKRSTLLSSLTKLKTFTEREIEPVVSDDDMMLFVGIIRLAVKVIGDKEVVLDRIPRLICDACHRIETFSRACSETLRVTHERRQTCLEAQLAVLTLVIKIVRFMRSDVDLVTQGSRLDNEWEPLGEAWADFSRAMDVLMIRSEALQKFCGAPTPTPRAPHPRAEERRKIFPASSRGIAHLEEQAEYPWHRPCCIWPSQQTTQFFNRQEYLKKIELHLGDANSRLFVRSLALFGLSGVGKSSIALKFAHTKILARELDAFFWIPSEKATSLQQRFTEIATRLQLRGARPADHDKNRGLVMEWLHTTRYRWLLVYDNAVDVQLLEKYWPNAGRGMAIITSNLDAFSPHPAENGLEIPHWDDITGSKFLQNRILSDLGAELQDADSTYLVSKKLSGRALHLEQVAGLIHRREWNIIEFTTIYNEPESELHRKFISKAIYAIWKISFGSLTAHERTVLGIMCFLQPDEIPQDLFKAAKGTNLLGTLSFCNDEHQFSAAVESLLSLALIKRNPNSKTLSIHRLVQESYFHFMTPSHKQQHFNEASILVSFAFPRRNRELAELFTMWPQCANYLQHVLSLKDHFRRLKGEYPAFCALPTYCELNNSCQRYLLEIDDHPELVDLIEVSFMAIDTLPKAQQTKVMQGEIVSHYGQMFCRTGKGTIGLAWLKKSYEIFCSEEPFNATESGWAANNLGTGYATAGDYREAIKWHERAREHWLAYTDQDPATRGHWPATIKTSMGRAHLWAGNLFQARNLLTQAVEELKGMTKYQWAGLAEAYFALGNLSRRAHDYDFAEAYFREAQNAWLKGDQCRSAPLNESCMYKLGCIALEQGKLESAIKHLRDALAETRNRSTTFLGEHARVMFKLSEALEQEPGEEQDALQYRQDAERLLCQQSPDANESGAEAAYDDLTSILWR